MSNLIKINYSSIASEDTACVYCGHIQSGEHGCCSEMHFETMYTLDNDEAYLESECTIVDDRTLKTKLRDYVWGIKQRLYWLSKTSPVNATRIETLAYRVKRLIPTITKQRWGV